jgi:2-polyprenyl-3-methyl-5-hydroxy-6-metoxy-1,4-benzoquinol methylase
MFIDNNKSCPICQTDLIQSETKYSIEELFKLWDPIRFSSETIEEHKKQAKFTVLHACPKCKLEIFLPQIIGSQNFYIEAYNLKETQKDSEFTYIDEKWDFDEAIKDVKLCKSIIELGCGNGNFLERAKAYVQKTYGIEYNDEAIKVARKKGIEILRSNSSINKLKGQFDGAFSFHVLEHVDDPISFMKKICSLIKLDGKIGISVPNQDGPIKYINPCIMNMPPHHATRWRLQTLKELALRMGLTIDRVAYEPLWLNSHYYYSWYWVQHLLQKKSLPHYMSRLVLSKLLQIFFRILSKLGYKYFRGLKGQSIYVRMSKY